VGEGRGGRLPLLKKLLAELDDLATACRDLVKDVDLVFKLAARILDALGTQRERLLSPARSVREGEETRPAGRTSELPRPARNERGGRQPELDSRTLRRLVKELDARRKEAVEQLKAAAYVERQAHWLLSRFPDAKLVAVPGLVKLVDRKEIEAADWSLTPGRYVGVAPPEVDDDFDFEQTLGDIHVELADLNQEAVGLAKKIQKNFEELGV